MRRLDLNQRVGGSQPPALPLGFASMYVMLTKSFLDSRQYYSFDLEWSMWCSVVGLNHRPRDYQSRTLPTELTEHVWKPRCLLIANFCSCCVLAPSFAVSRGASGEARTPDLQFTKRLLFHLSYASVSSRERVTIPLIPGNSGSRPRCHIFRGIRDLVMPAGFEPAVSSLRGWRPEPIRRRHRMVLQSGVEPPTRGFSIRCSTS